MKSKVITITYSAEKDDVFHYRVCEYKGHKCLIGWPGGDTEDASYDITDIHDLSLYEFYKLYQHLATNGHLLNLEETVCNQTPIFADNQWNIAKLLEKVEKE